MRIKQIMPLTERYVRVVVSLNSEEVNVSTSPVLGLALGRNGQVDYLVQIEGEPALHKDLDFGSNFLAAVYTAVEWEEREEDIVDYMVGEQERRIKAKRKFDADPTAVLDEYFGGMIAKAGAAA